MHLAKRVLNLFILSVFVIANISRVFAIADPNFQAPGKWTIDDLQPNQPMYNEISYTEVGRSKTVSAEYRHVSSGTLFVKSVGPDQEVKVDEYLLSGPDSLVPNTYPTKFWAFVAEPKPDELLPKVIVLARTYPGSGRVDYEFRSKDAPSNSPIEQFQLPAQPTSASNLLEWYAWSISQAVRQNPASVTKTGIPKQVQDACADHLIRPMSQAPGGNAFNKLIDEINKQFQGTIRIDHISDKKDLDLYHRYYKSRDDINYSDTYLDSVTSPTYQNFVEDYQLSEAGLTWFWTDQKASLERSVFTSFFGGLGVEFGVGAAATGGVVISTAATAGGALLVFSAGLLTQEVVNYLQEHTNNDAWNRMAELMLAEVYLESHVEYDRCVAQKINDDFWRNRLANEEKNLDALLKLIDQQLNAFTQAEEQSQTGLTEVEGKECHCDQAQGTFLRIICQAMCVLLGALGDIIKWVAERLNDALIT